MKFVLAWLIAALTLCPLVIAATNSPLDLQIRYGHYYASLILNEDGTSVGAYEWSKTVLQEAALERARRASVTYDTRAQKAEITAAYTLKADGRRIDVFKENYQVETDSFEGLVSPAYEGMLWLKRQAWSCKNHGEPKSIPAWSENHLSTDRG